jgi:UDP-N-acetylmuramoylalanine--D-glutamate ligase
MHAAPRRIGVLGLGRTGEAVVRWALDRVDAGEDVSVTAFVEHDSEALRRAAVVLRERGARVELGVEVVDGDEFDLFVASPGIAPHRPLMRSALETGVPVVSELELAYRMTDARFVAITGTNGKTTTTALVTHLLRTAGIQALAVGNIGSPAIAVVDGLDPASVLVAECSSFQLAKTLDFHPRVSVLLNITPDHLDWHGSMRTYIADKAKVFANQGAGDTAVVDIDDAGSAPFAREAHSHGAHVVRVSRCGLAYGGAGVRGDTMYVTIGGEVLALVRTDELLIRGEHNVSNALAGAAAALAAGADLRRVREGLRTFEPIEHRLEPVRTVDGVLYVNDSKATNPEAVLKALTAFAGRPVIVLLGGKGKGTDLVPLALACKDACRFAVLFGEAADRLGCVFESCGADYRMAETMQEAVELAAAEAVADDVVLLSPACASFDEFTDYEERGRTFKGIVERLAAGS